MKKEIALLIFFCIYTSAYSSTLTITYWGAIDKPVPELVITNNQSNHEGNISFTFGKFKGPVVEIAIPEEKYHKIYNKIKICSDISVVSSLKYFSSEYLDSGTEEVFALSIMKMIEVINYFHEIIRAEEIKNFLSNYKSRLEMLIEYNRKGEK